MGFPRVLVYANLFRAGGRNTLSDDGGQRFGTSWQLTTAFSDPETGTDGWMGGYTGNTWAGNEFIAAWMDSSFSSYLQEVGGGVRLK